MEKQIERELTVIIPNYNNAKYLEMCIDSVIAQSLLPYEIIIIDDCSTDNSKSVIRKIQEKNPIVKAVLLSKNGGVSNARNTGLRMSTTKYVTFMDSDDFYYNNRKLEFEMDIIHKYQAYNKDVLAYSATAISSEDGTSIFAKKITLFDRVKFIRGIARIQLVSMIKQAKIPRDYIIKRDVLLKVGAYSFPYDFYEDLDLLMRIAMNKNEFHCTYQYGTAYRMTYGGLSKRNRSEHVKVTHDIFLFYFSKLSVFEKIPCIMLKLVKIVLDKKYEKIRKI